MNISVTAGTNSRGVHTSLVEATESVARKLSVLLQCPYSEMLLIVQTAAVRQIRERMELLN